MTALDTTSPPVREELAGLRAGLVSRLDRFHRQLRLHLLLDGAARVIGEAIALAVLSFLLDRWLRLGGAVRIGLMLAALGFLAYEIRRLIMLPLGVKLTHIQLAALLDRSGSRGGSLAARMATVLELPDLLEGESPPSAAMVRRAVREGDRSLRDVQLEQFLDNDRYVTALGTVATLLVMSLVLALLTPATSGLWFRRWFLASRETWPQDTHLRVIGLVDGKLLVPRGEPFTLRVVNAEGSVAPETVSIRHRQASAARVQGTMNRFAPGDFRYEFPTIQGDTRVELSGGDDEPEPFTIQAVDRPRIVEIGLTTRHPTEAAPTPHTLTGQEADLSFLARTEMELSFTASTPVREARLKSTSVQPAADELRRIDDTHFAISWTHESAAQLQIELVGQADLTSTPTPISIGLKVDQPPRISLTYSGVRQRVTPQARIPLAIQARDDYGVARVDLDAKAELLDLSKPTTGPSAPGTAPATAPTSAPATTAAQTVTRTLYGPATKPSELEIPLQQTLEVAAMKLTPGSLLSVGATVTDACYLGPQIGRSRAITFRIVPPEELFKEILLRQQAERVKFRKQIEAAQKIAEALKTMPSPEDAAALSREHRLIQREVARTATGLAESVTEMKLNALGGQEAWDLMDKNILAPLKTLHDDTMSRQREALDGLSGATPARLQEAADRQSQIVATMQAILKQMSQWDSFVDVVNQLNEIIRLETRVKDSADLLKKKQTEGVFDP